MPTPYYNPYEEEAAIAREQADAAAARADELRRKSDAAAAEIDARKKAKSKSKKSGAANEQQQEFFSRAKIFVGILMMLLAAYMLVATLSMLANPAADQAAVQYNSVGQIVSSGQTVDNAAGPAGAKLSNFLLTGTFGIGSFVIIYWLVMVGLRLGNWIKLNFWTFTLKSLVLTTTVSIVTGLITYSMGLVLRLGGNHGYYVNKWLIDRTTAIGALCVSIALVSLVIIIYLTQITAAITAYRKKVAALKEAHLARIRKEKEDREKLAEQLAGSAHESEMIENPEEDTAGTEGSIIDLGGTQPLDDDNDDESGAVIPIKDTNIDEDEASGLNSEMEITAHQIEEAEEIITDTYDPTAELSRFRFPSIELLEERACSKVTVDKEEQEANKQRIINALAQFDIHISDIKATVGPTITLFEVVPAEGQRIAAIKRVEEDIALALKAIGIRIIAPIPGKGTIGIEVPNNDPQVVSMRSIIASKKFQECKYALPMALGATISNEVFIADLAKMPHLLVAGATGQGKSVGLNAIITSLLYKKHPAELKFVLVDPKMVEFSLYRVLEKHYLAKLPEEDDAVITDCNKVVTTLNSLCVEMDNRYTLLKEAGGCRNITEYNQKFISRRLNPEKGHHYMPYIVLIIDEFADLIMQAGKEIEVPLCRIAQKARAVGIHAIIATQRPSTNVVTGLIKAQFPGRIAFRVAQMIDSKTILDRTGAHQLIGKGDMFFSTNGNIERVQCAFVDTPEVEAICESISEQQGFANAYELPEYIPDMATGGDSAAFGGHPGSSFDRDPLFEEAARFLVTTGNTASTSSLQRRYNIGYNRAGRLMDQLEAAGIVGPAYGSKPRNVLVDPMTLDSILGM